MFSGPRVLPLQPIFKEGRTNLGAAIVLSYPHRYGRGWGGAFSTSQGGSGLLLCTPPPLAEKVVEPLISFDVQFFGLIFGIAVLFSFLL